MSLGWKTVPFLEAMEDVSGGNEKTPQSELLPEGLFPVVDQGKALVAGYINDPRRVCKAALPVVVFGDHTRCYKFIDFPFCMGADGTKVLRPRGTNDAKYLYHCLRQLVLTEGGYDRHFKYLKRQEVVLPPLSEQQRIAKVLDAAEALRTKRCAALAELDMLAEAIFLDTFGDPVTNPKPWPTAALRGIATTTSGGTPDRSEAAYYNGGVPWVKSGELHQRIVTRTEETISRRGVAESSAKLMPAGTVLVAMYGATVGAVATLAIEAATNQAVCCIRLGDRLDNAYFVTLLKLLTPTLLLRRVGGAQPNLSQDLIRSLELPLPPVTLQRAFALRIDAIEKVKIAHRASLAQMDALFASLQHRAFRGEL